MKNYEDMQLSVSNNLYHKEIDQHLSLSEIMNIIASNHSLDHKITTIRHTLAPQNKKHLKNQLPLFFPAIELDTYKRIDDNKRIRTTGLIHFDIDIYDTTKIDFMFKQLVEKVPYLVYAFRSPRYGLKFALASDLIIDSKIFIRHHYALVYHSIKNYLQTKISNLVFDNSNERISQSCFFSFDPQLYINYTPNIFLTKDIINEHSKQHSMTFSRTYTDEHSDKKKQKALEALSFIPGNLQYHDRYKINLAITSIFGAEAYQILSRHWQHENPRKLVSDIHTQVTYAMTHPIMISAGTLFYYARKYGYCF